MIDREKVIKGLEHCRRVSIGCQQKCPYKSNFGCRSQLMADALELLKEQEPVKALAYGDDSYICNNCGTVVGWDEWEPGGIEEVRYKFCPECGKAVEWDETD
jgi:DNA-directed RNA polymerase subunit RPC12/RpoP